MAAPQVESNGKRESRVGKRPIVLPKGVTVAVKERQVEVKGAKGTLHMELPATVSVREANGQLAVESSDQGPDGPRLQGLGRALLANLVQGVSAGYEQVLELVGTGYRAEVKGKKLALALGFSHPVEVAIPEGLSVSVAENRIKIEGTDRCRVGQFASDVREIRGHSGVRRILLIQRLKAAGGERRGQQYRQRRPRRRH